ncbi:MAG TPA: hypothetical protein VGE59_04565 [Patescibacteria group bacterium]
MSRVLWIAVIALLSCWTAPAKAEEPVTFHGFWMLTADSSSNKLSDHTRWIVSADLNKDLTATVSVTPRGPLRTFSYGELQWKKPIKGIDQIAVGRSFPPFGRIWYDYRVDQVPVIYYSDIYVPLAATDTGVTVTGSTGRTKWYAGTYVGDPEFGNELGASSVIRAEYRVTSALTLATSQRISQTPAHGADLLYKSGRMTAIGELVSSDGVTQYLALGEYRVTKHTYLSLQHEWLEAGDRWTVAPRWDITKNATIKVGYQTGANTSRLIGQVGFHW